MSKRSRNEFIMTVRYHYLRSTKREEKGTLLDHVCSVLGWDRKHAIKVLRGHRGSERSARRGGSPKGKRGGPRPRYGPAEVAVLREVWRVSGRPCGKRLKAMMPAWLPSWEREKGGCPPQVRERLLKMSAAAMDRHLQVFRAKLGKRKPHAANEVRRQIPLRTGPWDIDGPGWIEADTVAHCGGDMRGLHAWSTVMTDIASAWTEAGATLGRHDYVIQPKIAELEAELPFEIIGMDTDNGGEFLNERLLRYWRNRPKPVQVSRSRPYRKNDNAHIEQKNRTLVRDLVGHDRVDCPEAVVLLDRALRLYSLLHNLFMPSMKLISKERGSSGRWRKHYEKVPRTPCQRLLESDRLQPEQRVELEKKLEANDPLSLMARVQTLLKELRAAQQAKDLTPSQTKTSKAA